MIKDQIVGFGRKAWGDFGKFTPGQKAVTIVAVLALLVGGYLLTTWKSKPQYAPLYSNLAASDASSIVDKLTSDNIPYQLSAGGAEILVPTADVDKARLAISAAGLPDSGQTGYALLDKEGVTTSQFQQQIDYQRAVEGELAKTIQSIDGVQAASVHLAIPQQDVFNDGTQKTTAAVLLTLAPGTSVVDSQVQSVVNLVSSSVPGLDASNVTVSDSNGNVLSAPGTGTTGTVGASTQAQMTQAYDNQLASSVQQMIDAALGPNHAVVTVNAALDFANSKVTKNSYLYNKNAPPVSQSKSKETYSGTGAQGAGGTLGTTDTAGTVGGSGNGKYAKTDTTVNNALGTVTQTTQNAPGQLQNLHIAVELDKTAKNLNVPAISQLVRSGVGYNAARGDSLSVQAVPFDNSAALAAAKSAKAAAAQSAAAASKAKLLSIAKQAALALLLIGIAVGTWLAARKRKQAEPPADDNVLGLDLIDDLGARDAETPTEHVEVVNDIAEAANRRRALVTAADNRPKEVAQALSGWLNTRES